jgi:hypothetical protein
MDFRDRVYSPSLIEVPNEIQLNAFRRYNVPVLDQGGEGACTGFGLAGVANYLLSIREQDPEVEPVSPRMLYEMAKRYDEWEGEGYEGSSARGAMKGWHKHGVCTEKAWPYVAGSADRDLTPKRIGDAARRPLGAYYRVNHEDLVSMHAALAETGALFATAVVHEHWENPDDETGLITPRSPDDRTLGGHAFAIVGYNATGFWLLNSWGDDWGLGGFALLAYEDWLASASDVWVARLGVPISVGRGKAVDDFTEEGQPHSYTFSEMRPHVIAFGDDGELTESGTYANDATDVRNIVEGFVEATDDWPVRRLALYAHGGLVSASSAIHQAARLRTTFLAHDVYPLFFMWHTDPMSTLLAMLDDLLERWRGEQRVEGIVDFLTDRTDDLIEAAARHTVVKPGWQEIAENGRRATTRAQGAARLVADLIEELVPADTEIHLVGHSAGSILLAPLAQYLASQGDIDGGPMNNRTGLGRDVASVTLWAPAATTELASETYLPLVSEDRVKRLRLFILNDAAERDDSAGPYRKSILYLVSNALEETARIPLVHPDGEPLLGMEKFTDEIDHPGWDDVEVVVCPTGATAPVEAKSNATTHAGFSSDRTTHLATLSWIVGEPTSAAIPEPAIQAHEAQVRKS